MVPTAPTFAHHDVEHAFGQAGFRQGPGQFKRQCAGAGVAGFKITVFPVTKAGASFQAGMATGKFHGVMRATNAERVADGVEQVLGEVVWQGLAAERVAESAEETEDVAGALHLAGAFGEGLAFLAGECASDVLEAIGEQFGGTEEDRRRGPAAALPARRGTPRPPRRRPGRRPRPSPPGRRRAPRRGPAGFLVSKPARSLDPTQLPPMRSLHVSIVAPRSRDAVSSPGRNDTTEGARRGRRRRGGRRPSPERRAPGVRPPAAARAPGPRGAASS